MKNLLTLVFFLIFTLSFVSCESSKESNDIVSGNEDSTLTLEGAGE